MNRNQTTNIDTALQSLTAVTGCLRDFADNTGLVTGDLEHDEWSAEVGKLFWLIDQVSQNVSDLCQIHMGDFDTPIAVAYITPSVEVH